MAAVPSGDEEKLNPFISLERHGFATSNKHEMALFFISCSIPTTS